MKEIKIKANGYTPEELDAERARAREMPEGEEKNISIAVIGAVDMINSIICYDFSNLDTSGEEIVTHEEQGYNYLADYIARLGRDTVVKLANAQLRCIGHIEIGVYDDDESGSYNAITYNR